MKLVGLSHYRRCAVLVKQDPKRQGIYFFNIGGPKYVIIDYLCHDLIVNTVFIPGSYASFVLLGAWLGWPNFDYNMVPSYDD